MGAHFPRLAALIALSLIPSFVSAQADSIAALAIPRGTFARFSGRTNAVDYESVTVLGVSSDTLTYALAGEIERRVVPWDKLTRMDMKAHFNRVEAGVLGLAAGAGLGIGLGVYLNSLLNNLTTADSRTHTLRTLGFSSAILGALVGVGWASKLSHWVPVSLPLITANK